MPTALVSLAPSPSKPCWKENSATLRIVSGNCLLVENAKASLGVANNLVVSSCAWKPARSVPEALAMCSRAALLAAFFAFINSTTSNHAPVSALPRAGLSLRVALLTTIMSMISPGIWLELKTSVTPGLALMSESIGFQVVTALT